MICLEVAPSSSGNYRALRFESARVVAQGEGSNLRALLDQIGAKRGEAVRVVLRSVPGATTRIIERPAEKIGSISEYIPRPLKELTWDVLPLGPNRTFLAVASQSEIVAQLDRLDREADAALNYEAVGLTASSVMALALAIEGTGEILFADRDRYLHIRRTIEADGTRTVIEIDSPEKPLPVEFAIGPSAIEAIAAGFARTVPILSARTAHGEIPPAFALAFGASIWGTEAFPRLITLEPFERANARMATHQAVRQRRIAIAASLVLLLLSGTLFSAASMAKSSAEVELTRANEALLESTKRLDAAGARLVVALPPDNPGAELTRLLSTISKNPEISLTEVNYSASPTAFAALAESTGRGGLNVSVVGYADSLDALDELKSVLERSGFAFSVSEASARSSESAAPGSITFRATAEPKR